MNNIFFIRGQSEFDYWDYYSKNTEIFVYSDMNGYEYLINCLKKSIKLKKNIKLTKIPLKSNSMRVIITAPLNYKKRPMIRIIERPIYINGDLNMEVVFCGNKQGYLFLLKKLDFIMKSNNFDTDNHMHFEEETDFAIVRRSVHINVRYPIKNWRKKHKHWTSLIYGKRRDHYFPKNLLHFKECIKAKPILDKKTTLLFLSEKMMCISKYSEV